MSIINLNSVCRSGQEELISLAAQGREPEIYKTRSLERPVRILRRYVHDVPSLDVERAIYFTRSMKQTEGEPLVLRWAKALRHIVENITVYIAEDQLLAGQAGGPGRHAIVYPEIDGPHLAEVFRGNRTLGHSFTLTDEDKSRGDREIVDYWKERGYLAQFYRGLPEDIRPIIFDENMEARFIIVENGSYVSSLNWVLDFAVVLEKGMKDIRRRAQEKLDALDPYNAKHMIEKKPFYQAVIMTCDSMKLYAERHALLAEEMAADTQDEARKQELLQIARHCRHVPENPPCTFWEAVQSQWFVQLYSRLEAKISCIVSQGRMDQYFYPTYKADVEAGRLDDEGALEILNCLWASMAKFVDVEVSELGAQSGEGYAHWENVTVGGQLRNGEDATNELSYLLLRCAREFPTNYPDLSARVHSMSPRRFLWEIAETIKAGAGYPKLFNDEDIVTHFINLGAPYGDALDYSASGCTEVRMPNRDTFITGCPSINYGAMLEATLYNGKLPLHNNEQVSIKSGNVEEFSTWNEFWEAFKKQHDHFFGITMSMIDVACKLYERLYASPLTSCLHKLCMDDGKDIHEQYIKGGVDIAFVDVLGVGTLTDSLCAIKKMVYEDKILTISEVLNALKNNFDGENGQRIRKILMKAPKYGNNDPYADAMAREIDRIGCEFMDKHTACFNGYNICYRQTSVTAHVPFGACVGATPDGRYARAALSDGASPAQGHDTHGPTAVLQSQYLAKDRSYIRRAARLLNTKLTPASVAGDEGTERLVSFIRTFVDLKLWHIQFNVINQETLIAAQKDPESYRNLIIRIAGYSAYFCDLSKSLQDDLINRTANEMCGC